ncbi:MAG: glycosyltransferase family 2 protein [Actinomycetes bacterium]
MVTGVSVAVVIPAYNAQETIRECIQSVRTQTFIGDVEILVVDDGSTDDTGDVARELGCNVVRQANAGPAAARNRGVLMVGAPLVAFLDSDDVLLPGAIASRLSLLEGADLLITSERGHGRSPGGSRDVLDFWSTATTLGGIRSVSGWIVKRNSFLEIGGFREELRCLEDVEFVMRSSVLGRSVVVSDVETFVYRWAPRNRRPALGVSLVYLANSIESDSVWSSGASDELRRSLAVKYLHHALNVFGREGDAVSVHFAAQQFERLGLDVTRRASIARKFPRLWCRSVRLRRPW